MYKQHQDNIGYFVEQDHKHEFTYKKTTNPWAIKQGFEFQCDVGMTNNSVRFCNVTKTRAYVCVDENEDGSPLVKTWILTKHVIF